MFLKKARFWFPACLLITLILAGLSGCGTNPSTPPTGGSNAAEDKPDRVQVEEDTVAPQSGKSIMTLTNDSLIEQLYATVFDLEPMPENQACTAEMGPSYTLTFMQAGKTL